MWTRKELKEKGKVSFKKNYWKAVLVSIIMIIISGGFSGGFSGGHFPQSYKSGIENAKEAKEMVGEAQGDLKDAKEDLEDTKEDLEDVKKDIEESIEDGQPEEGTIVINGSDVLKDITDNEEMAKDLEKSLGSFHADFADDMTTGAIVFVVIVAVIFVLLIVFIAMAVGFAISAFVLDPIEVGCNRFFTKNLDEPAAIGSNVLYAFDHSYLNVAKTMFFRDLYITLWGMLFVIPGIVKAYEYRMIPYLLAEHPEMTKKEVFAKSREMMSGNKWKAFVLDLSFIGWNLLSILTCGILSIFYVNPYINATNAALYDALKDKEEQPEYFYNDTADTTDTADVQEEFVNDVMVTDEAKMIEDTGKDAQIEASTDQDSESANG
ncbi:MAG: DUF975 family protein [Lachnospiraceae bacterium]|nr:DUF975 family protein [Lachnospiraceae bacterium]